MLNPKGLLNQGLHRLTLEQIKFQFGGFQGTDRRCKLFDKFEEYVKSVVHFEWFRGLIVDGSFVTEKSAPSDIDMIVLLDADWELPEMLRPAEYNLLSRRMARRRFGFDVIAVPEDSEALKSWLEYFSRVRGTDDRKGLVQLSWQ